MRRSLKTGDSSRRTARETAVLDSAKWKTGRATGSETDVREGMGDLRNCVGILVQSLTAGSVGGDLEASITVTQNERLDYFGQLQEHRGMRVAGTDLSAD
jgi:hypothetical protein